MGLLGLDLLTHPCYVGQEMLIYGPSSLGCIFMYLLLHRFFHFVAKPVVVPFWTEMFIELWL